VRIFAVTVVIALLGLAVASGTSADSPARPGPVASSAAETAKAPTRAERRCRSLARQRMAQKRRAARAAGRSRVSATARAQVRRKLRRCLRAARRPDGSGGSPGDDPAPGDGNPTGPGPGPPAPPLPRFVGVTASDNDGFRLALSRPAVAAGDVTIELRNTDSGPHDLVVEPDGGGAEVGRFDPADPGVVTRKVVTLAAGRWRLFCSLPNHAAAGMEATLRAE
jgi:plastocyanin